MTLSAQLGVVPRFVDDSSDRLVCIRQHFEAVHRAIDEGANAAGCLRRPLLDNFK